MSLEFSSTMTYITCFSEVLDQRPIFKGLSFFGDFWSPGRTWFSWKNTSINPGVGVKDFIIHCSRDMKEFDQPNILNCQLTGSFFTRFFSCVSVSFPWPGRAAGHCSKHRTSWDRWNFRHFWVSSLRLWGVKNFFTLHAAVGRASSLPHEGKEIKMCTQNNKHFWLLDSLLVQISCLSLKVKEFSGHLFIFRFFLKTHTIQVLPRLPF